MFLFESTTHFFLHCLCFSIICKILFNELISICKKFIDLPDSSKVELLLYRSPDLSFTQNSSIINASINYTIKSERFKGNLFELISIQNYILSYPEIAPLDYIKFKI